MLAGSMNETELSATEMVEVSTTTLSGIGEGFSGQQGYMLFYLFLGVLDQKYRFLNSDFLHKFM